MEKQDCPACDGTGLLWIWACHICGGTGLAPNPQEKNRDRETGPAQADRIPGLSKGAGNV
jgi:DnaJ-class molecular chaperone